MEKLGCVLWKPVGTPDAAFAKSLREAAPALTRLGAHALRVNVVDDDVAAGAAVRVGRMDPPKAAFVTFWLHEAADLHGPIFATLAALASRVAAYLVVESVPIRNTTQVAPPGERTPGFNLVTCIVPRDGLSYDEFLERWHVEHRRVALETQPTFSYVRNEIVRALTPGAPPWAAIVEETFPIGALTDPKVFYAAKSDEDLRARMARMMASCQRFLDFEPMEFTHMSEYHLG